MRRDATALIEWHGEEASLKVRAAALRALYEGAEHILAESNKICPHDTGRLERSGETSIDIQAGLAAISYDTEYAAALHENAHWHFQQGKKGKWLEITVRREADAVVNRVVVAIRGVLGR
jgi:hypothetical protein